MDIGRDIKDFIMSDIHFDMNKLKKQKYYCIKYLLYGSIEYNVHTDYYYYIIEEKNNQYRLSYLDGRPFAFWIDIEMFNEHFATEQKTKLLNLIKHA